MPRRETLPTKRTKNKIRKETYNKSSKIFDKINIAALYTNNCTFYFVKMLGFAVFPSA